MSVQERSVCWESSWALESRYLRPGLPKCKRQSCAKKSNLLAWGLFLGFSPRKLLISCAVLSDLVRGLVVSQFNYWWRLYLRRGLIWGCSAHARECPPGGRTVEDQTGSRRGERPLSAHACLAVTCACAEHWSIVCAVRREFSWRHSGGLMR